MRRRLPTLCGSDRQACPLVLRLSVDNPRPMIFGGMRWILLASAGIVVLLAATFLYILHTLFRAKSLEMMRRDLTHNITHELKTPIAVAYASCDALRSMPDMARDDAVRGEYLDMVLSQLSSLSQMVEQILQASLDEGGRAPLQLTECRLGPLVDSLMREMNMKYASKRIAWHVDVGQDAAVAADRFLLTGILSNLIDNAVKYSSRRTEYRHRGVGRERHRDDTYPGRRLRHPAARPAPHIPRSSTASRAATDTIPGATVWGSTSSPRP